MGKVTINSQAHYRTSEIFFHGDVRDHHLYILMFRLKDKLMHQWLSNKHSSLILSAMAMDGTVITFHHRRIDFMQISCFPKRLVNVWNTTNYGAERYSRSHSIVQPLKNFLAFYGTGRFIAVFTRAHKLPLSWLRPIQATAPFLVEAGSRLLHPHPLTTRHALVTSDPLNIERCEQYIL